MKQNDLFSQALDPGEEQVVSTQGVSLPWKPEFHISELYDFVDLLITENPYLNDIVVIGEISRIKFHNHHLYIDLQDQKEGREKKRMEALSCIFFNYKVKLPKERYQLLKEGFSVKVRGNLEVYRAQGKLSLRIKEIEPYLSPGWMEKRKRELFQWIKQKGLDSDKRKKRLPKYIWRVVVVTSEQGAVIHDIRETIWRRNPLIQIYLVPSVVQGEKVCEEVPRSLQIADQLQADVVILARGGGSPEELWYFNEKPILLAVAQMKTPVISAIGHEIDKPLVDLIADVAVPTPTAAAELVSYPYQEIISELNEYREKSNKIIKNLIEKHQFTLRVLHSQVETEYKGYFYEQMRKLDGFRSRLKEQFTFHFYEKQRHLNNLIEKHQFYFQSQLSRAKGNLAHRNKELGVALWHLWRKVMNYHSQLSSNLSLAFKVHLQSHRGEVKKKEEKLKNNFFKYFQRERDKVHYMKSLLNSYDYRSILERGFVLVYQSHRKVARYREFQPEKPYRMQWIDGSFEARGEDTSQQENT